jgi:hypothetical protein
VRHRFIPWLILLTSLALACKVFAPGTNNLPGDGQAGEILFEDDFSDPLSGWSRVTAAGGKTDYDDGVYRILVNEANTDIWTKPGLDFRDVRIEVTAFKVGGDRDNRFGIICRAMDANNFYTFIISSDGYYGIGKIKNQGHTLIGMDALQPSDAISLGSSLNHIRADCIDDNLSLYVNGQLVAQVRDLDFPAGDVGLIAGTYATPGTDIRFDDFIVRKP